MKHLAPLSLIAVIAALTTLAAWAGPFMHSPPAAVPDELKCLADLRRVSLYVNTLPKQLRDAGMTAQGVQEAAHKQLTDAGFEIIEDPSAPMLVFTALALVDPTVPDSIAFVVFIDVKQKVLIYRLERDMVVPTATLSAHGVKRVRSIKEGVEERFEFTVAQFISMERSATAVVRSERG